MADKEDDTVGALSKVLKAHTEVVSSVYKDGLSTPVKESGKLMTDLLKTTRLVLAPVQYAAYLQDKLESYFDSVTSDIEEEDQIEPNVTILLPLVEKLRYQEEGDVLTSLYLELLKRALLIAVIVWNIKSFVE